jgi:hypothetical protein
VWFTPLGATKGLECNVLSLEVVTREVRIRIKCKELDLTSGIFFFHRVPRTIGSG